MTERYIGLMSGTSVDGVDGVLAAIDGERVQALAHVHVPFADSLQRELTTLMQGGANEIERMGDASVALANTYAQCVDALLQKANLSAAHVRAIGAHGQTIRHRPERGFTLQLNHPALLGARTGIDVVADFRSADVAHGGQGAPLVPAFHEAVFAHASERRVIVNIGGIANVSVLNPSAPTRGWDTGPGNTLLDAWCAEHTGARYDADGAWGAGGTVHVPLLDALLREPYFSQTPPKSTGRETFHLPWLHSHLANFSNVNPQDVQATLVALTAQTIADAAHASAPARVFVCGGGARNGALMRALATALAPARVDATDALGCPVDQVEALAFAWLAKRCVHGQAGNQPATTGARAHAVLGAVYLHKPR
jgi:anhydro-N-acetylmuramic acid kinase